MVTAQTLLTGITIIGGTAVPMGLGMCFEPESSPWMRACLFFGGMAAAAAGLYAGASFCISLLALAAGLTIGTGAVTTQFGGCLLGGRGLVVIGLGLGSWILLGHMGPGGMLIFGLLCGLNAVGKELRNPQATQPPSP